jgi:hypothetical protein
MIIFRTEESFPYSAGLGFVAVPELFVPNSSITLAFAEFPGYYLAPSNDLWFPAHSPFTETTDPSGNASSRTLYLTDKTINVLACTEQHQFCNPNLSTNATNCTPLQSIDWFVDHQYRFLKQQETNILQYTLYQDSIANVIVLSALGSRWGSIISVLESAVLADNLASNQVSLPLPPNQWILEASNWFSITLANLQNSIVNTATGPSGTNAQYTYGLSSNDTGLAYFCRNQIVQRQGYTNFSLLAIGTIFFIGGGIIVVSMFLESLVGWLQIRFGHGLGRYRQVRWQLDPALQLQRMAFEETGLGTWSRGAHEVPVTEKGQVFAPADEWDVWHPSIKGKAIAKVDSIHIDIVGKK